MTSSSRNESMSSVTSAFVSPSPFGVNVKSAAVFDVCDPTMLSCSCDMLASKPCLHGHLDRFLRVEFASVASVELPDTSDMASTTA